MRRWQVIAEPEDPTAPTHVRAAIAWNKTNLGSRANAYWLRSSARIALTQFPAFWDDRLHLVVARVR